MSAAPALANLSCPRCGYAFRGEHESWSDAWPLEGRCAECGLSFLWRDIFNPQFGTPRWLVEARSAGRFPLRRTAGTLVRAMVPSYFWHRLSMNHPIRRTPLIGSLALLWVPVFILFLAVHVQTLHAYIVDTSRWAGTAATPHATEITRHILTHPFSSEPLDWWSRWGIDVDPDSPRAVNLMLWTELGLGRNLLMTLAMPLVTALAFIALPVSRRRARVRRAHVIRITAYAYALMSLPVGAVLLSRAALAPFDLSWSWLISTNISAANLVLGSIFALWWWHAAIRRYLRMEHSIAVVLSVWIIGILSPIAISSLHWALMTPATH